MSVELERPSFRKSEKDFESPNVGKEPALRKKAAEESAELSNSETSWPASSSKGGRPVIEAKSRCISAAHVSKHPGLPLDNSSHQIGGQKLLFLKETDLVGSSEGFLEVS